MSVSEASKSIMTQMTLPLSESECSPSGSFKIEDVGEPDVGPLSLMKEASTKSLDTEDRSTRSKRFLHLEASAPSMRRMTIGGPVADSMPSVPTRRGSYSGRLSRQLGVVEGEVEMISEHTEDDDVSSKPPMERTVSRRLSDSERRFAAEKDEISPPRRVESFTSLASADESTPRVAQGSRSSQNHSSSSVTDEAIESMILAQIPEHIRNQMTPEMWKKIFTVNTISNHMEAASVCSDITDDLRSIRSLQSPPAKRRSIDHTGLIEDISPTSDLNIVRENLESHSTFRTEDSNDLLSVDTKDLLTESAPSSYRSTSSTKEDDTVTSTSSPVINSIRSKPVLSSKSPKDRRREPRGSHRSSRHQTGAKGDAPPRPPRKNRSIRSFNRADGQEDADASIQSDTRPGRRVPKKQKLSIRFNPEANVRHYERVLEVHPSTSSGPSLGIGWRFVEGTEKLSFGRPADRRNNDMLLSRQSRERIVRVELGYSSKEIASAIRDNLKIKNQRRRTVNNLKEYGSIAPVEKVEYLIEKCQRKLGQLRLGRKSSSQTLRV